MTTQTRALLDRRAAAVARGVPTSTGLAIASAKGAVLTDVDGKEILDLASGIGVMTVGHSNPAVVQAIVDAAQEMQHLCMHISTYEGYIALCERLGQLLPHGDHTKAMLVNSGSEAVENAIKIARQATGRSAVICYTGAFHGRTLLSMTLTSKVAYKDGCGPFAPEIYRLPFPNVLRRGPMTEEQFVTQELRRFRKALVNFVAAENVAAVIIEPVQGEGGFVVAPTPYLQGLRDICTEHGIVLIFDEVQSGFCRTGDWGAYQMIGVTPDLSTWAKAMGGGMPIAAVVGNATLMDQAKTGTIGGTFGGNPIACAAALAAIGEMERLKLCARATVVGGHLRRGFQEIAAAHLEVVDVRGIGAMLAIEVCVKGNLQTPAKAECSAIKAHCESRGLLIITAGVGANIIRALPPLVITNKQLEQALTILAEAFRTVLSPE